MRGGHNTKPIKDLKKAGTYRPDRHSNRLESTVKPLQTLPLPPAHFDERHAAKWREVVANIPTITAGDLDALELYVANFFLWQDALSDLKKSGLTFVDENGKVVINPALRILSEAGKVVLQIGGLFGFSPRARMGIRVEPNNGREKAKSILEYIKGGAYQKAS